MLHDTDSFVRWCAYDTLKRYYNLGDNLSYPNINEQKKNYDENKYYTGDSVYADKVLFENRLMELKTKISNLH